MEEVADYDEGNGAREVSDAKEEVGEDRDRGLGTGGQGV